MKPRISSGERVFEFSLSDDYYAILLDNIQSTGIIQYYYILIIYDTSLGEFQKCYCSEWSNADPELRDAPILGVFENDGHRNLGWSTDWLDIDLFLLCAIDLARKDFGISSDGLNDGEILALTNIFKKIADSPSITEIPFKDNPYSKVLSKYDDRMAEYMGKSMP